MPVNRTLYTTALLPLFLIVFIGCSSLAQMSPSTADSSSKRKACTPTILSPAPNAAIKRLPITVQVKLNGQKLSELEITLDGAAITSSFRESNGIATAEFKDGVYVGKNRLSVAARDLPPARSSFSYVPARLPGLSAPPPDTVPIQTQVQTTNSSKQTTNGVEVGQTIYPNPGASTEWQLLLLSRTTLSIVANNHYNLAAKSIFNSYVELIRLLSDITPGGSLINRCGQAGCLMVLQGPVNNASLYPVPCGPNQPYDYCGKLRSALAAIGATPTPTYTSTSLPAGLGYSFIGNVGLNKLRAGVNFERITCSNADGCVKLPAPDAVESNDDFLNGIAPNGVDGVLPNLADTADNGTTDIPATGYSPAMTVYNNGSMHGLLVTDNNSNYTFVWTAPPIQFQMGPAPDDSSKHTVILQIPTASQMRFPGGESVLQVDSAAVPADQTGGFHLVVLNATTLVPVVNATYVTNPVLCPGTCQSPDGTTIYSLDQLPAELTKLNSRGNLWFLGSFGSLAHDFPGTAGSPRYQMQDVWDRVAQSVQDLGGTYATFAMLANPALAQNDYDPNHKDQVPTNDDYNMVGQLWINASGVANPYAAEASRAISRQTMETPVAGNMQGVLKKGNDGFYAATQHSQYEGVVPLVALDYSNAPYLLPIPWPLTGTNDPVGPKNAYQFISNQLLRCTDVCGGIRAQYSNLDQSSSNWYSTLEALQAPTDCNGSNNSCGFTAEDFATAKTQLLVEISDVTDLRNVQTHMVQAAMAAAPDFNTTLTEVQNLILGSIPPPGPVRSGADTTNDVLNLLGSASGIAAFVPVVGGGASGLVRTAISTYQLSVDDGSTLNDPAGVPLKQQEEDFIEVALLAKQRLAQYRNTYGSIGMAFNRVVSDWGRMQAAAAPIVEGKLQFEEGSLSTYLQTYDISLQRSLYAALMPLNFYAVHYRYADPGLNRVPYGLLPDWLSNFNNFPNSSPCFSYKGLSKLVTDNPDSFGFWEGALMDGPGATLQTSLGRYGHAYPFDAWWDVWFVGEKHAYDSLISDGGVGNNAGCPAGDPKKYLPAQSFFQNTGLFKPIRQNDSNALGLYKPWFLGRGSLIRLHAVSPVSSYVFWGFTQKQGYPKLPLENHWAPDPDNY